MVVPTSLETLEKHLPVCLYQLMDFEEVALELPSVKWAQWQYYLFIISDR